MRTLDVVRMGVLCVLYFATAKFGLSLDAVHGFAAAVWAPTGIALMALVLYGYRLWRGNAIGRWGESRSPKQILTYASPSTLQSAAAKSCML